MVLFSLPSLVFLAQTIGRVESSCYQWTNLTTTFNIVDKLYQEGLMPCLASCDDNEKCSAFGLQEMPDEADFCVLLSPKGGQCTLPHHKWVKKDCATAPTTPTPDWLISPSSSISSAPSVSTSSPTTISPSPKPTTTNAAPQHYDFYGSKNAMTVVCNEMQIFSCPQGKMQIITTLTNPASYPVDRVRYMPDTGKWYIFTTPNGFLVTGNKVLAMDCVDN
ncbi:hypothetical protein PMAYCL1PPCAC_22741 [Pristionchus mayeri]|uniref:Apple domain-containing protein n=1 Tax=Pristionchus mayeri TaxID=1317129 RepID=A0AAN5I6T2_9BILA|nr:hypothetical protein PMAYCL1PPCAC_22741 [Pristionchus mayeri]